MFCFERGEKIQHIYIYTSFTFEKDSQKCNFLFQIKIKKLKGKDKKNMISVE
jgi:hypothetical protein